MAVYTEQNVEGPSYVRWQAVLSGAAVGLAVFFILSALWFALAGTARTGFFGKNLAWFALADALVAALVAGYIGGYVLSIRGRTPGMLTGLTVWGVIMFAALIVNTPQLTTVFDANTTGNAAAARVLTHSQLWATFGAFLGGFVLAGLAGGVGGGSPGTVTRTGRMPSEEAESGGRLGRRVS
jgi:hypothetical protein